MWTSTIDLHFDSIKPGASISLNPDLHNRLLAVTKELYTITNCPLASTFLNELDDPKTTMSTVIKKTRAIIKQMDAEQASRGPSLSGCNKKGAGLLVSWQDHDKQWTG